MAAGGSLDDLINSNVDENAYTALVGTLQGQLYSGQAQGNQTTVSGATVSCDHVAPVVSACGAVAGGGRAPSSATQHVVVSSQSGIKGGSLNISRGTDAGAALVRSVPAHSQPGVLQTAQLPGAVPSTIVGSGNVGSVLHNASVVKIVHTGGVQAAGSQSGTFTINSGNLPNGSTSNAQTVITNGKQTMTVNNTNKVLTVAPASGASTIITVSHPANVAGSTTRVAASAVVSGGMQILNVNQACIPSPGLQGQKTLAPRVLLSPQVSNRAVQPGQQQITLQTLQSLQNSGSGHILVKTENGQLKLIQLPDCQTGTTTAVTLTGTSTNALPMYKTAPAGGAPSPLQRPSPAPRHPHAPHGHLPNIYKSPVTAPTTPRTATAVVVTAAAATPAGGGQPTPQPQNAMAPDTAKLKCKNFLATLLRLAKDQPETVARNVRTLIQSLIDARIEPEAFTTRLQHELNSSPQPCLVPFLKKSLPFLRQSLYSRDVTIEGVKPPPVSALPTPLATVPTIQVVRPAQLQPVRPAQLQPVRPAQLQPVRPAQLQPVRLVRPVVTPVVTGGQPGQSVRLVTGGVTHQRLVSTHPAMLGIQSSASKLLRPTTVSSPTVVTTASVGFNRQPIVAVRPNKKLNFRSSFESGQDDDINDVAAMGGVNLQEESQHILGGTEYVGTQIRSVRDDTFLHAAPLQLKIRRIAMRHGLEEPSLDVVSLVSHATQERLKTLLEQVAVISEHRLESSQVKSEPGYEVYRDVRGQLRFLDELDKLEQKRHGETEREMLLRAAKSRSKTEDPEQAKLKAKAKEMQRVEMEEVRQREANLTALQAIGPRKKARLEEDLPVDGVAASGTLSQRSVPLRPRVKRVNMRDLLYVLEQDRDVQRSERLFRLLLK